MALINDPDLLSQGTSTSATGVTFGTPTGSVVAISGTGLPAISAGDYFEIRSARLAQNNGLYKESGGSPTTSAITATKLAGDNGATPVVDATSSATTFLHTNSSASTEKSVYFDFYNREIWLLKQGNLSDDGVTLQALYSFSKEEWKSDSVLIPHPYPFTAITPEQFELTDNWVFHTGNNSSSDTIQNIETRKLVRTGGWREIGTDDILDQEWVGVITLGQFEDNAADTAYYQQGNDPTDTAAAVDFTFAGPVNEPVRSYYYVTTNPANTFAITSTNTITRTTGSWITDGYRVGGQITIVTSDTAGNLGTYTIASLSSTVLVVTGTPLTNDAADSTFTAAVNNRNVLNLFLRIRDGDTNGKTFAQATLTDIGVTEVDNKVFRFPITNATDLKISATDATISSSSPYTAIKIRYFDQAFTQEVQSGVDSNFGIVIDVGTFSGVDGSITSAGSSLSTTEGGIPTDGTYDGGTLTIWEGTTARGNYTIGTVSSATAVPITTTFPESLTNVSFSLQRATPISATAEQIYEKVQYQLRQAADIDATDEAVTGTTASALLRFVGDTLEAGQATPVNPNGGGSGVSIVGFDSNDTNRINLFDNTGTSRSFPFVAAGTINFNTNLQNDTNAKFWMFFQYTVRTTPTNGVVATVSGRSVTFTVSDGATDLPTLVVGQFINVGGYSDTSRLNGIYRVTTFTDNTTGGFVAYKVSLPDSVAMTTSTGSSATVYFDENPIDSPDALIVNNNSGTPITGDISGSPTFAFDFDYDNNEQGERVAGQGAAAIVIRAIGFDTAQFVETTGTITRATGQSFSLVSALERNYANAA
jgi:hypothetical protein